MELHFETEFGACLRRMIARCNEWRAAGQKSANEEVRDRTAAPICR